jgi:UDP-glucose 4-epimerase
MNILVFGGAGYIGSHLCKYLHEQGHQILVFDNLSTGHKASVKWGKLVEGDILNPEEVEAVLSEYGAFDLIMHFCAKSLVGESVTNPLSYYKNNVVGTLNILEAMIKTGHKKIVFSSTAAVYGNPETQIISESSLKQPINPYGHSKSMVEQILSDLYHSDGLSSVTLRYFNACGAHHSAEIGEKHEPETHLIPNILKSIKENNSQLNVFGDDYPTKDGTCIRDYIHVMDLASAHLLAGVYLEKSPGAHVFNLGNGQGFSVFDVLNAAEMVTGKKVEYTIQPRRIGDPPILVADASAANRVLGWKPNYTNIETIIESAWKWHQNETF